MSQSSHTCSQYFTHLKAQTPVRLRCHLVGILPFGACPLLPPPADCGAEPPTRGGAPPKPQTSPKLNSSVRQKKKGNHMTSPGNSLNLTSTPAPSRQALKPSPTFFFLPCAPLPGIDGSITPYRTSARRRSQFFSPFIWF